MADVLVTGTDTGIGKTVIAAALVKAMRRRGVRALGFKPAETGVDAGQPVDSVLLARASGETTPLARPLLQLPEPLAPAVAAERAGTVVHPEEIEERIELLRRAGYSLVIEGSGGVMVPLSWVRLKPDTTDRKLKPDTETSYTVLDLAAHCGLDAIVVGRAGLGTLNHVAMTVAMLRSRNIPVRAVVLNGSQKLQPGSDPRTVPGSDPNLAEATNPSALARMLPSVLIIEVPRHLGSDAIDATVPYLGPLLS